MFYMVRAIYWGWRFPDICDKTGTLTVAAGTTRYNRYTRYMGGP